jgi:hypothetical protein
VAYGDHALRSAVREEAAQVVHAAGHDTPALLVRQPVHGLIGHIHEPATPIAEVVQEARAIRYLDFPERRSESLAHGPKRCELAVARAAGCDDSHEEDLDG